MRWLAGVMVWFTIIAFIGLFGFGKKSVFFLLPSLIVYNTHIVV